MRKLKWIVVGAMLITVISVLVGCGARLTLKAGSNTGSGSNNRKYSRKSYDRCCYRS